MCLLWGHLVYRKSLPVIAMTNGKLRRSAQDKNLVSWFGYNDYMAYPYAFMMKVVVIREPESFAKASTDPRWVEAMNKEMQAL